MKPFIIACFVAALTLSLYEFVGILRARALGLTKSTERVVMRGIVFGVIGFLAWQHWDWQAYVRTMAESAKSMDVVRLDNEPYLICAIAIGFVLAVVVTELASMARARREGKTANKSRFISSLIILACLVVILRETDSAWDRYTAVLERTYVPQSAVPGPRAR